ncbi:unnamed protein product [Didymodactylos carnosus]|uniref:Large ribosomal subunit protein mL54 n=1 Tax=Didymodactylos carnosus TaxID=1234261 RepID=A0A814YSS3_9BILA|nr:unnamed protein product [Didymodactylos carnosus]CAF3996700.1 unnamed protein product [Didymodactylos carnosus]
MLCLLRFSKSTLPNVALIRCYATDKKPAGGALTSASMKLGAGIMSTKKGAVITAPITKELDAETDPVKLVNYCSGLNYKKDQEPVKLKPDNEYPEWLFNLYNLERWYPEDLEDKETWRYWRRYRRDGRRAIAIATKDRFPLRSIPKWLRELRPLC